MAKKWVNVTSKIIRKLARVAFFMLFQTKPSKVTDPRKTDEFVWSSVKGRMVVRGSTSDT